MRLLHITHHVLLPTLLHGGLMPCKSKGKRQAVYACKPGRLSWALRHIARRHGWQVADLLALEVDLPRRALRRVGRGLYCTARTVEVR